MKLYPNDLFIRLSLHPINSIIITFRCLLKFYFTPEQNSNTEFHLCKILFHKKNVLHQRIETRRHLSCVANEFSFDHSAVIHSLRRYRMEQLVVTMPSRSAQWKPYNIISCFVSSVLLKFLSFKKITFPQLSYLLSYKPNTIKLKLIEFINILNYHICCQTQNFWDHRS